MSVVSLQRHHEVYAAPVTVPCARTTLDFSSLDDHARLPARFFGSMTAADAVGLTG
jgi:hypothetical protein